MLYSNMLYSNLIAFSFELAKFLSIIESNPWALIGKTEIGKNNLHVLINSYSMFQLLIIGCTNLYFML